MNERLAQLYESVGFRDFVEVVILALAIYAILRFLSKTRGSGVVRGLALVVIGFFLVAQVIIASLDLHELSKILDYLLTWVVVGLLVVFQPELRRGLMVLGRYRMWRYLVTVKHQPIADKLADAAEGLSRDCVGGLIAIQRELTLAAYIETGEAMDAEISAPVLRTIFTPRSPLHDGAVIICNGRIAAAACQLPLSQPPDGRGPHMGMRHRAALGLSEETDALLLVVSEETGRISLAMGGRLEVVARENLSRRLAALLSNSDAADTISTRAA
ncbi:MAG: diadenylate cyclase [Gemmataceae bacterium]|nr:diadenylate cyclase [Gemmataceae bacterium]